MKNIMTIYLKELRDILRDKGTFIVIIVFPLLIYPLLMLFYLQFASSQTEKMKHYTYNVGVVGRTNSPLVMTELEKIKSIKIIDLKEDISEIRNYPKTRQIMRENKINLILYIPPDFKQLLLQKQTANIELFYDYTDTKSNYPKKTISDRLKAIKEDILAERLKEKELVRDFIVPLKIKGINIASMEAVTGSALGLMLPMFLISFVIMGALHAANDLTAGEKERNTLQTLLLTPVERLDIVIGKYLAVVTLALITCVLNLGSMAFSLSHTLFISKLAQGPLTKIAISYSGIFFSLVILFPLVAMLAAVSLAVCTLAKSTMEANIYSIPVLMLSILPATLVNFPGIEPTAFLSVMPIANVALMVKEVLRGVYHWPYLALTFISTSFYAGLSIYLTVRLFNWEEIMFMGLSELSFKKVKNSLPSAGEVFIFFLVELFVFYYLGSFLQGINAKIGLLLTEFLLVLLPCLLYLYLKGYSFKYVLRLNNLSLKSGIGCVLIGMSCVVLAQVVAFAQSKILPVPSEINRYLSEELIKIDSTGALLLTLLLVAVTPAICEEVFFRGVILTSLEKGTNRWLAIVTTGILFGVFHLNLYQLLAISFVGIIISYLVVRTNSIYAGAITHLVFNGSTVILVNYAKNLNIGSVYFVLLAIALFIGGLLLIDKSYERR